MKILFVHPNMPGQYKHLARIMGANPDNKVVFITLPKPNIEIPGVHKVEYTVTREPDPGCHRYLLPTERAIYRGQEAWRVCKKLKDAGFTPDIIVGHFGWGEGLYLKDVWPNSPMLGFMEFYYSPYGSDVAFYDKKDPEPDDCARIRSKNMFHLMNLTQCEWGLTPTFFQLHQHPKEFYSKISVLHDGIDTEAVKPKPDASVTTPSGLTLTAKDEVVTYVSRNFEPYRGFNTFMKAAEIIQKERPNCHIVMVGGDGVSYGRKHPSGRPYFDVLMNEVKLDKTRLHRFGLLPYSKMLDVMYISQAHVYLTVPFVLSWSMMESMAAGCLMVCSDTDPVREVMQHEHNGLLADFFSPEDVAKNVIRALKQQKDLAHLRTNARKTIVDRYALKKLMPMHVSLVEDLAKGEIPPATAKRIDAHHKATA